MGKVVFHVGPSKTASTTIQKFLSEYTQESELTYPKWGWTRADCGHHNLAYQLREDERFQPELGGLDKLEADLAAGKSLFLSSEDFPIYAPFVKPVKALCDKYGFDLEVLFFVRDPISRLNSMYTQQIKTFVENCSFQDFITRAVKEDKLYLRKNIKTPLQEIGVNLRFAPFIGSKLTTIFAEVLNEYGFKATAEDFEHTNPAPSPEDVALYRQIGHKMQKSEVNHWLASNQMRNKYGLTRKYFGFDQWLINDVKEVLKDEYSDMAGLGLGKYAQELEETFFQVKPKCADIEDNETFIKMKADIIELMKL